MKAIISLSILAGLCVYNVQSQANAGLGANVGGFGAGAGTAVGGG